MILYGWSTSIKYFDGCRLLDVNKDPFRPQKNNEELLGPEIPYLSAIGALMYLANTTRPDIAFLVNLLDI